jgi:hypothetical protein
LRAKAICSETLVTNLAGRLIKNHHKDGFRYKKLKRAIKQEGTLYESFQAYFLQIGFQFSEVGETLKLSNYVEVGMMVYLHIESIHLVQVDLVEGIMPGTHQHTALPNDVGLFCLV